MLANKVRAAREARCADSERNRDALAPRARACLCVILRGLCCVSPSPQRTLRIGTMMTTTASKTADSLGWSLRVGQSLPDGRAEHLPPATTDCCRRCGAFVSWDVVQVQRTIFSPPCRILSGIGRGVRRKATRCVRALERSPPPLIASGVCRGFVPYSICSHFFPTPVKTGLPAFNECVACLRVVCP